MGKKKAEKAARKAAALAAQEATQTRRVLDGHGTYGPRPESWASAANQAPEAVERRASRARVAGQAAAARMTPEARQERARRAGLAAAAKRRANLAAGLPARTEKPREEPEEVFLPRSVLKPYLQELARNPNYSMATETELLRQATYLHKAHEAKMEYEANRAR